MAHIRTELLLNKLGLTAGTELLIELILTRLAGRLSELSRVGGTKLLLLLLLNPRTHLTGAELSGGSSPRLIWG